MTTIAYFRNVCRDGGIHLGLYVDDDVLFENWKNQAEEPDPVLDWWIDVRCQTAEFPKNADQIRDWFLGLSGQINDALEKLAKQLDVGMDGGVIPFHFRSKVADAAGKPVEIEIKGAASARVRAPDVARQILDTRTSWQQDLAEAPSGDLQAIGS